MRIFFAVTLLAIACGSPPKKQGSIVEGTDVPQQCCCKTLPSTAEKEIVPNYTMMGNMECSSQKGDCVDEVQCTSQEGESTSSGTNNEGVPPPPALEPSAQGGIGE